MQTLYQKLFLKEKEKKKGTILETTTEKKPWNGGVAELWKPKWGTDLTNEIKYYWGQPITALMKFSLTSVLSFYMPSSSADSGPNVEGKKVSKEKILYRILPQFNRPLFLFPLQVQEAAF